MAKPKAAPTMLTPADAISIAYSELQALRDELQGWLDGIPDNLQDGSKAEQLNDAIGGLEEACDDEPDLPPCFEDVDTTRVEFAETPLSKRASRRDRRDYAVQLMRDAVSSIEAWRDDQTCAAAAQEFREAREEVLSPEAIGDAWEDHVDLIESEVEVFGDEIASHVDSVEAVEFPGMFG